MDPRPWFSRSNVRKGILTTVLGLALIVFGVYALISPDYSILESVTVILLGLGLLGIKDPRIPGGGMGMTVAVILSVFLSSCITLDKCARKFGSDAPHEVTVHDTVRVPVHITVPGDRVTRAIDIDSMLAAKVDDTLRIVSEAGRARAAYWKDQYNNVLYSELICPPVEIHDTVTQINEVKVPCPKTVVLDPAKDNRWYIRLWNWFRNISAYLFLGLLAALAIKRLLK